MTKTKTCRAHCGACGLHFSSDSAFDAHRRGDYAETPGHPPGRHCIHPIDATRKNGTPVFEPQTEDGECRVHEHRHGFGHGPEGIQYGVTIWAKYQSPRDRARLAASLAERRANAQKPSDALTGVEGPPA